MDAAETRGPGQGPTPADEPRLPGEQPSGASAPPGRGLAHALLLCLLLAGPLLLVPCALLLEPDARGYGTHEQLGLAPCGALERWGLPCPGCGVTTAVALAARGRLLAALAVQPLGLALVLALPLWALWALAQHLRGRDLSHELAALRARRWALLSGILVGLSWAYRLLRTLQ
jgi:hypothetical protein